MKIFRFSQAYLNTIVRTFLIHALVLSMMMFGFSSISSAVQADHVILIVLEGVGNDALEEDSMPYLKQLAKEGAITKTAQSLSPPLSVPSMASLLTGVSAEKHRITAEWETYDFSRSFLRAPTFFDYMDLAGGRDTALFLMDERFYQLSRPEIYVDSQMCGTAKPECNPITLVGHIQDYLKRATSEGGHGVRLFTIPALLVAHLPEPAHIAAKRGFGSKPYRQSLRAVDTAISEIINTYHEYGVLDATMVLVLGLNGGTLDSTQTKNSNGASSINRATVPWIAWGANIKPHYQVTQPVSIMDTGATVMEALGLETYTEWDSHAIKEIFQTVPERRTTEQLF